MNLKTKYYGICIPSRIILFICILVTPNKYMIYWFIPAILSLCVVLFRYITYNEKQKGGFGQPVRWQHMRIYHLIILVLFIVSILTKQYTIAKILPLLDLLSPLVYTFQRVKKNKKKIYFIQF